MYKYLLYNLYEVFIHNLSAISKVKEFIKSYMNMNYLG